MIEHKIFIRAAENFHPQLMFGRCVKGELVYALAGDGRNWTRQRHETCEVFEERICRDLHEHFITSMRRSA